jgi:hypothetical protein
MTAREKARELVEMFRHFEYPSAIGSEFNEIHKNPFGAAKQCAVIAVDEILDGLIPIDFATKDAYDEVETYWQQVKEEINKL